MKTLDDSSIDLVVTSPPYAEQRSNSYIGVSAEEYAQWFLPVAKEIHRVLRPTGSFVLNIKEHCKNGVREIYVLKTVLELSKLFNFTDTYIWNKTNPFPTGSKRRLKDGFEYCFWFTKSKEYKFFPNEVLIKSTSRFLDSEKRRKNRGEHNCNNGSGMNMSRRYISDMVRPSNVLTFPVDTTNHLHPATFPISIPSFFIRLMTEEHDVVLDPFCGSGTTLLAAKNLNRSYLGCDNNPKYIDITKRRL